MKFFIKKKLGFSILEVIIVIGVVVIGLLGVIPLVIQNQQVQNIDNNYLIASMLSQEGLELVRNKRDNNWLTSGVDWHDNIDSSSYTIDYYNDDFNINDSVSGIDHPGAVLKIDSYGYYSHDTGNATIFSRIINVIDHTADDYIIVSSTVRFKEHGRIHDYVSETYFYAWRY